MKRKICREREQNDGERAERDLPEFVLWRRLGGLRRRWGFFLLFLFCHYFLCKYRLFNQRQPLGNNGEIGIGVVTTGKPSCLIWACVCRACCEDFNAL